VLLYRTPLLGPDVRTVVRAHFGGSSWPLPHVGDVYVGLLALGVNLLVAVLATPVLRGLAVREGVDRTRPEDYLADSDDEAIERMSGLIDGETRVEGVHVLR